MDRRFLHRLVAITATSAVILGSCASPDALIVHREVPVGDVTVTDIFAPPAGEALPVVVLLHGTAGDRSVMEPLAQDLAEAGMLVFVPAWPVIEAQPGASASDEMYRAQAEAVVCSLRHARQTAADYGGDPGNVVVVGQSGGAAAGGRAVLVAEPPWPGIDCFPGVDHRPRLFVGSDGGYTGEGQYATVYSDLYNPYDLFQIDVTNPAIQVRIIHGFADDNVQPGVAVDFHNHLVELGIDSAAIFTDTNHGQLIDPDESGDFLVQQVTALALGQPSAFDDIETAGSLTYSGDTCSYQGARTAAHLAPMPIALRNETDVPIWFSLVGLRSGLTADEAGVFDPPLRVLDNPPGGVVAAGFVGIPPHTNGLLNWVFTDGDMHWVTYCMPDKSSEHPHAGLMHPAAEISMSD